MFQAVCQELEMQRCSPRGRSSSPMRERNKESEGQAHSFSSCILAIVPDFYHSNLGTIFSPFSSTLAPKFIPSHLVILILVTYIKPFRNQDHPQSFSHILAALSPHSLFFSPHSSFMNNTNSSLCPTHSHSKGIYVT